VHGFGVHGFGVHGFGVHGFGVHKPAMNATSERCSRMTSTCRGSAGDVTARMPALKSLDTGQQPFVGEQMASRSFERAQRIQVVWSSHALILPQTSFFISRQQIFSVGS
jgi:hypothetical protein